MMKINIIDASMPIDDTKYKGVAYSRETIAVLDREDNEHDAVCPRCAARGKTWSGSNPICAFAGGGAFSKNNWCCATLNDLRELCDEKYTIMYHNDKSAVIMPGQGSVSYVMLTWYKQRGTVLDALEIGTEGTVRLTLKQAEAILAAAGK
jgi:hypothetical protein